MTTHSPRSIQRAREGAHQELAFLATQRQQNDTCETAYCGDLELLTTWRWLLGFHPDAHRCAALHFPTGRLWALAWRVNIAFPPVDVISETVREWQGRQASLAAQKSGEPVVAEDVYGQIAQIASAWSQRARGRLAAYQTSIARCVLSATVHALGTPAELKLLAEASRWATCFLLHPAAGDLAWIAVYEAQSDTNRWLIISWCADHLSERAAPRGPHQWPASMRRSFREWTAQHS